MPKRYLRRPDGTLVEYNVGSGGDISREELDNLSEAITNKADASGWTANKYIGTDAEGNLIERDAPATGTGGITEETDPTVPEWAKQSEKPTYTKTEIGLGNVDNVRQYSPQNPPPYPVTSVNGQTGDVYISAEHVRARPETWMPSASDVGADASGTADTKVAEHNTSDVSHNDIRLLITGLTNRLNALANSTDEDLDQIAEIVTYIKANKSLIDGITTNKVSVTDIVDNLTTSISNKPLSAKMGVELKKLIDAIKIPTTLPASDVYSWAKQQQKPTYTASEVGALPDTTKIPAKTSDIANDSGFITRLVADLTNYYTKSQTYTQTEVNALVSAIPKFAISVVSALPTSGISTTTVYLVKSGTSGDLYTEYIYVNGEWEILGSQKVDLTGYATEAWVNTKIADFLTADKLTAAIVTAALGYTPAKAADVPAVDGTLKVSGAAADAAVVGGKFTEVSKAITDLGKVRTVTPDELANMTSDELAEEYSKGVRIVIVSNEYENLVPTAVSENGGVYNGCGYMNGIRINSSGGITQTRQGCVTGYIPFVSGKKLYIYGSKSPLGAAGNYVATYDDEFNFIGVNYMESLSGITEKTDEKNLYTFEANTTQSMFNNASYIRVSLNPCEGKDIIVRFGGEVA